MNKIRCMDRVYTGYTPTGVIDRNGLPITNLSVFYELLESVFTELIEILTRIAINSVSLTSNIPYVIMGGKAINNIISKKYLVKSFDFDIHITDNVSTGYNATDGDVDNFGTDVVNYLEYMINSNSFKIYRLYIINILKKYNIIDINQENFYLNEKLFYYGERIKPQGFRINGFFIHLKFRDDLFGGPFYSNAIKTTPHTENELYFAFSDIDLEEQLNFGMLINDNKLKLDSYDGLKYATYNVLLNNLISYATEITGFKVNKNLNKLKIFTDIDKYTCNFTQVHDVHNTSLSTKYLKYLPGRELINNKTNVTLFLNGTNILETNAEKKQAVSYIKNNYLINRNHKFNECSNSIVLNNIFTSANHNLIWNILHINFDENYIINQLEDAITKHDYNNYIRSYTGNLYTFINDYCQYIHLGMDTTHIQDNLLVQLSISTKLSDISDRISKSILDCRNDDIYNNNLDFFKDEFYLYRAQNFVAFNSPFGTIFNPGDFNIGDLIFIPNFQSTSYVTNYNFTSFVKQNTFFFRIKVNKNSKKWIMLNSYSYYPNEKEVLVDKNVMYYVTGVDYLPIKLSTGVIRDIMFIDVTLIDNFNFIQNNIAYTTGNYNLYNFNKNNIPNQIINLHNQNSTQIVQNNTSRKENLNSYINKNRRNIVTFTNQNTLFYDYPYSLNKNYDPDCERLDTAFKNYTQLYSSIINNQTINSPPEIYIAGLDNDRLNSINNDRIDSINNNRQQSNNNDRQQSNNNDRLNSINRQRSNNNDRQQSDNNNDRQQSNNNDRQQSNNNDRLNSIDNDRQQSDNNNRQQSNNNDRLNSINNDRQQSNKLFKYIEPNAESFDNYNSNTDSRNRMSIRTNSPNTNTKNDTFIQKNNTANILFGGYYNSKKYKLSDKLN